MRFTIEIDGKETPMCASPMTKRIYRKNFHGDLITNIGIYSTDYKNDLFHNEKLSQIIWSFAKTANPTLPKYNDWVDSCTTIPVKGIFLEIREKLKGDDFYGE